MLFKHNNITYSSFQEATKAIDQYLINTSEIDTTSLAIDFTYTKDGKACAGTISKMFLGNDLSSSPYVYRAESLLFSLLCTGNTKYTSTLVLTSEQVATLRTTYARSAEHDQRSSSILLESFRGVTVYNMDPSNPDSDAAEKATVDMIKQILSLEDKYSAQFHTEDLSTLHEEYENFNITFDGYSYEAIQPAAADAILSILGITSSLCEAGAE